MKKTLIHTLAGLALLFAAADGNGQGLVADYTFDDTMASAVGGAGALEAIGNPAFQTDVVDGVSRRVLAFEAGEGCRLLTVGQTLGDSYTIVVLFRFDSINSWKRVIDFRNRVTDWGLYSYYGNLNFYNVITGTGGAIEADAYVQIALTRNAQGTVRGYVNGVPEIDFSDGALNATLSGDDILSFFQDDVVVANEHAAGAVSRIRIWDGALGEAAVAALDRAPGGAPVPAPEITSGLEVTVTSGDALDYTLTATHDPTAFSATGLESWMAFDAGTGALTGTAGAPGVYDVGVSAFNAGGSDSETLRVTVLPASGSTVGFAVASLRVAETAGVVEVTVRRQGDATGTASVSFATADDSALDGVNYTAASGTLDFADGVTEKTVLVDVLWVEASEADKAFTLGLSGPVNTVVAQPTSIRVVIEDVPVPSPEIEISAVVRWLSVAGATYRVLWTDDLDAGTWAVFRDNLPGTGGEMVVIDPLGERRFYRVELVR